MGDLAAAGGEFGPGPPAARVARWREAVEWYRRSLDGFRRLERQGVLTGSDAQPLAHAEAALASGGRSVPPLAR